MATALREEVVEKTTEADLKVLAGIAVNNGWGAGRQAELDQYEGDIDYVYRSALLDGRTCEVCERKDGVTHEYSDPEYLAPDPACKGGAGRCRCINIAVMKAESEQRG